MVFTTAFAEAFVVKYVASPAKETPAVGLAATAAVAETIMSATIGAACSERSYPRPISTPNTSAAFLLL